jgi:hypothetical protein
LYGEVDMVSEDGRVLRRYPTKSWNAAQMAQKCYVSQPSVFIKREVYETCGPLYRNLMLCLDYEYWHRVAELYRWKTLDRVLALTRIYPSTKTASRRLRGIVEGCCVSRHYSGRLPLRWVVKYMCRRARLAPRRYVLTPAGWLRWLAIAWGLPRRLQDDVRRGWTQRFLLELGTQMPTPARPQRRRPLPASPVAVSAAREQSPAPEPHVVVDGRRSMRLRRKR